MLSTQKIVVKSAQWISILSVGFLVQFSALAGDIELGQKAYNEKGCTACHGAAGISAIPTYPNLAGQKEAYLIDSITQYKSGARKNAIMAPMAAIVNEEEIKNIAAYLASLK